MTKTHHFEAAMALLSIILTFGTVSACVLSAIDYFGFFETTTTQENNNG